MIQHFIDFLLGVPPPLAYLLIGTLVFSEAALFVGFVLPGETAVLFGGVLASTGHLNLVLLMALVVIAAVVGDTVGFEVGRHFGPKLLEVRALRKHRGRLESAQGFLRKRGGWAVVLGRWTAFLRAVMPSLAGASRMHYPTFLTFNASGGLIWGVTVVLLGYFAGTSYQKAASLLGQTSAVILGLLAVGVFVAWHQHRKRTKAAADEG
jgi:membrane protein DedA with SNARE-associated domain